MESLQQSENSVYLLYVAEGGGSTNNNDRGGLYGNSCMLQLSFLTVSAYKGFSYSQLFASFILVTKEGFEIPLTWNVLLFQ